MVGHPGSCFAGTSCQGTDQHLELVSLAMPVLDETRRASVQEVGSNR